MYVLRTFKIGNYILSSLPIPKEAETHKLYLGSWFYDRKLNTIAFFGNVLMFPLIFLDVRTCKTIHGATLIPGYFKA